MTVDPAALWRIADCVDSKESSVCLWEGNSWIDDAEKPESVYTTLCELIRDKA